MQILNVPIKRFYATGTTVPYPIIDTQFGPEDGSSLPTHAAIEAKRDLLHQEFVSVLARDRAEPPIRKSTHELPLQSERGAEAGR